MLLRKLLALLLVGVVLLLAGCTAAPVAPAAPAAHDPTRRLNTIQSLPIRSAPRDLTAAIPS